MRNYMKFKHLKEPLKKIKYINSVGNFLSYQFIQLSKPMFSLTFHKYTSFRPGSGFVEKISDPDPQHGMNTATERQEAERQEARSKYEGGEAELMITAAGANCRNSN